MGFLFVLVYDLILWSSWNFLQKFLVWCCIWSSINGAALAVAIPAMVVTWISVLVLLTFCGKPRKALVLEGRKITADITGFVIKKTEKLMWQSTGKICMVGSATTYSKEGYMLELSGSKSVRIE
ncbi:hypothetical protein MKW94_029976 [Papaver nudicaule]|uniref:Uncharacterized protein n=1 Tax=Papaver nudicaule TaxID=74823 RepID=A0AA41S8K0_PAPNU|nr:hypothetical protein [Papaver nudicaule]